MRRTAVSALAAVVDDRHRGQGVSTTLLLAMRHIAAGRVVTSLLAPLRPASAGRVGKASARAGHPKRPRLSHVPTAAPTGATGR